MLLRAHLIFLVFMLHFLCIQNSSYSTEQPKEIPDEIVMKIFHYIQPRERSIDEIIDQLSMSEDEISKEGTYEGEAEVYIKTILSFSQTCEKYRGFSQKNILWKNITISLFGASAESISKFPIHTLILKDTGDKEIGFISSIKDLYSIELKDPRFTQIGLASLEECNSLRRITFTGKSYIPRLPMLEKLDIREANHPNQIENLTTLTNLKELSLRLEQQDNSLSHVTTLNKLENLRVDLPQDYYFSFDQQNLKCLASLIKLKKLHVGVVWLDEDIRAFLEGNLPNCYITDNDSYR